MNSGIYFVPTANVNIQTSELDKKNILKVFSDFILKKSEHTEIPYKVSAAVKLENQFKCNPAALYYTISCEGGCVYVNDRLKETKDKV